MKRNLLISIFIITVRTTLLFSQSNESISDGYKVFKYPNGAISGEGLIRNGKPDGFWKSYYVTGVKKSEGKRTNFLLDSIWVFFDQTGDTIEKINYIFGKKNGYYFKYKKDPAEGLYIWSKELFAGDKKEGTAYIYFPDKKIKELITYNNGKKEGLSKEFDKDGNVITLLEYSNDFLVNREKINRTDNNKLKQGEWKEFYPEGGIKSEKSYKDDQLHGYYKEYNKKGILTLTMLYENGSIVKSNADDQPDIEIVNKYDQSGKLIYSGPYRNKVPVGIHREYGPDGKIINSKIYNDNGLCLSEGIVDEAGNKSGKWKDLYPSGKVQDEGQYLDNKKSGLWKFNNESEKVEQTGYFNAGRPDGMWKWYYENGSLLLEEEYFQGQRDGAYTEYSPNGEIIAQGQYSDGEKNGEWKYKSGNNIETGKYIIGLRDGVWKSFYADGGLKFKGNFIQGNAHGTHTYYYEDGKIKEERYYQMGIREKSWKKFDENGTLLLSIAYKNDVEITINGVKIKLPESDVKLIK
jgi:antitoxin component YwqK of YwqJK toxin-antitoxin module